VEQNFTGDASAPFVPKPAYLAALAAQTGIGNASTFVGRVAATLLAPPAWNLTSSSAFVYAFAGGTLPQPAAAFAVYSNVSTCVAAPDAASRAACGAPAVDEMGCLALGCCFDEALPANATGVPKCYAPAQPAQQPDSACPASERSDCGYDGIGEKECTDTRGCCWDSSSHPSGPQCFFHADQRIGGPVNISFPVAPAPDDACFSVRDVYGFDRGSVCATAGVLTMLATDGPAYLL
jgi:hypothetical protein